jgi:hypothetical protein
MDFCGDDGVNIVFPQSMSQYGIHYRRAITSGGVSQSASHMIPLATPYKTITSTLPWALPWGSSPYYYTQPEVDDGTATVVYAAPDTSIPTTHYITTTIPSGQAEYTSFFTDTKSAVITEVIAVTSGGTPQPISPTTPNSSGSQPQSQGSSGLSSEAKIGIAVTVPIVFILLILALIFFLRKRKKLPIPEHQEGYNRLAEPITNISELKGNTPSFPGEKKDLHVEAEGVLVHEMSATVAEPRCKADGNPRIKMQRELATTPAQAQPLPQQMAPVSASNATSVFPLPWNNAAAAEYEHPQQLNQNQGVAIEDPEIAQLEEEAARMKKKRERLQEMQELEEREEEIRRSIWERKKAAASGT